MNTEIQHAVVRIKVQDARQRFLDKLYDLDGRHEVSHPMHGLYTKLYQQYVDKLQTD